MSVSVSSQKNSDPFAELWTPHRYKVFYGGRGSGKSMAVAEYLVAFANAGRLRILCCREIQNSIRNSSYQLLKDTIQRLGLSDRYVCTESEIRNTATGSLFLFKGLSHNEDSIKSTEGIDIAWVEEAQSVSTRSLDILAPTVRKQNSELIFTLNPNAEDDPIAVRYMKNPPAGAYVRKVNYDENKFFPEVLRREMEWDKANDYEKYLHVWEGYPLTISEAQIFKGKYVVEDFADDLWMQADRLFFGADFGFAKDPNTLVRCFIIDRTLYIEYEAYGVGVEIDEMPAMYRNAVPLCDKWRIHADCARPETISYLSRQGFDIVAADKWQGSIEDGIAYLKGFDRIVIHPRCKHAADEFRLYSYKTDKLTGEVLPIVLDKNNHVLDGLRYALSDYIKNRGSLRIEDDDNYDTEQNYESSAFD